MTVVESSRKTFISAEKTTEDWKVAREQLVKNSDTKLWKVTCSDYFFKRLFPRYLSPIEILQRNCKSEGEGFAILAVQCSLIEFLESITQGINYRHGKDCGQYEYNESGGLFVNFLNCRHPFSQVFDQKLARDFYKSVRCGILHEARTKNGWRVHAGRKGGSMLDRDQKIIYRNGFQSGLQCYIDWYCKTLPSDKTLQQAFIRKYDNLCE